MVGGWTTSAYVLTCREPLKTLADLKGKRVRATGGNAEMLKMAGMVPVGATLVEAVGLLQRGGTRLPARHHRLAAHLRLRRRRQIRHGLSARPDRAGDRLLHEPRYLEKLHARAEEGPPQARRLAQRQDGDRQFHHLQRGSAQHRDQGQGRAADQGRQRTSIRSRTTTRRCSATPISRPPRTSASRTRPRSSTTYEQAVERWRPVSKEIGRDIDKFTDALKREIFSKVDPESCEGRSGGFGRRQIGP